MIILALSGISLSFGTDRILDNVSFNIQQGEKAGLVGVNGAGKSTLFKIISGNLKPDSGDVFIAKGQRLGILEQNSGLDSDSTIWAEALTTYSALISMEEKLKQLEKRISLETDPVLLEQKMKEYDTLMEKFSRDGGYEYNSRIRGVLRGLGFEDEQFSLKISTLSGGQKTRLALAKLLLTEPEILMLDEPTNHLDMQALEWLEDFLKGYRKSVLVISHDRYFLDSVTSKTVELENCECKTYNGSYSVYARRKAEDRLVNQRHFEQQQKEIARMEAFIEQQRRWNREKNIIAAESRQKAIDRMEKIDAPKKLPDKIKLKFRSSIISGNDVLFVEGLSMEFPGKPLFDDVDFEIKRNENVFLLGPNGCGKSTLLKILSGRLAQTGGSFEFGHKIVLGYYDQELSELDENRTVLEEVWDADDKLTHTVVRNVLAQFLFSGEDVFKTVRTLSGGEKSRVALAKLMLSQANLLILDEPTNHLDIDSREALEEALLAFDGTILAVSHDRYFIRKLATRIIEMTEGSIFDYKGDYAFYLDYRKSRSASGDTPGSSPSLTASKQERIEGKEERARKRKLEKQLEAAEKEIGSIESRLDSIEQEMSAEEAQSDHVLLTALVEEQAGLKQRLDELYVVWAELTDQQEQ